MDEINTQFQCSLKLSAHLDMFQKHFKENKKTVFLFVLMNIFLQSLYNLEKQQFFRRTVKAFYSEYRIVPRHDFNQYMCKKKDTIVFPEKTCIHYITEVSTVGQILLQRCGKDTSVFIRNVNNHGINQETVSQIVRFISQFSMKIG